MDRKERLNFGHEQANPTSSLEDVPKLIDWTAVACDLGDIYSAREGRTRLGGSRTMLSGSFRRGDVCQPAPSSTSTAMALVIVTAAPRSDREHLNHVGLVLVHGHEGNVLVG